MNATLDGVVGFEQVDIAVGSWERGSVERSAAGVDGVVSVDLGLRRREIVQRGLIWAFTNEQLRSKFDTIRMLMDGGTHTMIGDDGSYFDRLRVDGVEEGRRAYSGRGVSCEFEIRYRQLGE